MNVLLRSPGFGYAISVLILLFGGYVMAKIIAMIFMTFFSIFGGGATIFLVLSFPAILIWKLYRVVKYGYKFTD